MRRIIRLASKDSDVRSSFRHKKVFKKDGFTLLYLGHAVLNDSRASEELAVAVMQVKQTSNAQKVVQILCQANQLYVKEGDKEIISSPFTNISQCVQHTEQGFNDCLGLVFNSGPWFKQCHVFQAKTSKEAAEVVFSVHKCIKAAIKSLRRKTEIPSVLPPDILVTPPATLEGDNSRLVHRRRSDGGIRTLVSDSPVPSIDIQQSESNMEASISSYMSKPSPWKRKKEVKNLKRSEKIELVAQVGDLILESNAQLRQACCNQHPQSPFERALYAITCSSVTLLSYLLDQHMLGVEACDHDGNTLIHYAVAMKKIDAIHILYERLASLEHPSGHKLRPLHRAVIDGDKQVILALLERGAKVNTQDDEKNTPLHYAASRREQHESCWVLLQYGAMVSRQNAKQIRPIDLLPDLKEMQNRLIISMCKSFSDPKSKPPTLSPSTSSALQQYESSGFTELLEKVRDQAKFWQSKLRKRKFNKISRSISNLSELLEVEEDEMNKEDRLQKLQFPLLNEYPLEYIQIEENKNEVQRRLNDLIRYSKNSKSTLKRSTSDPELSSIVGVENNKDKQTQPEKPGFSENFKELLQLFEQDIPPPRPYPPHLTEVETSSQSTLSAAFESLQQDLEQSAVTPPVKKKEDIVKISPRTARAYLSKPDVTPPQQLKSKDEAIALLDDYISQIRTAADELEDIKPPGRKEPQAETPSNLTHTSDAKTHSTITKSDYESPFFRPKKKTYLESNESSSSSETRRRHPLQDLQRHGHYHSESTGSNLSISTTSLSSLHCTSHHGSLNTFPIEIDSGEPGAHSLNVLVLLSANPECIQPLISHICLSEFKDRLLMCACLQQSSLSLLINIAKLVQNIFEIGGADGRKTALESGMMDIILKLLSARDPIPGTCLMLLNSLLVSDDDNDYLRTIVKIPCYPLLAFLEHTESDTDSGLGSQRDPSFSSTTTFQTSHTDESKPHYLPFQTKERAYSVASDSSSGHSGASPTLQGQFVTQSEARRIVLKMLAMSSMHTKMKIALSDTRTIGLLTDYVSDVSQENRINAVITLANIAQNISSHDFLCQIGLVDKLRGLLTHGPRLRYQAIRTLVYLGKLQLSGCNLFESSSHGGYEPDIVIRTVDDNGHTYVRGVTIETAIDLLTSNCRQLWGGILLRETSSGHLLSKEKTVDFFLTTYRSFMHPLIFMRLLLHRLDTPNVNPNPFNWSQDAVDIRHTHVHTIPPVHQAVLNVIGQWIESFPEDFRNTPQLQDYLGELAHRLRKFRGVYTPHGHRLRSLLHDLQRPVRKRTDSQPTAPTSERHRIPHHENLYIQCKQLVSEDLLPVTMEMAIHLAGLQLHIETLIDNTLNQTFMEGGAKGKKDSRIYLTHLKHALPAWCFRAKNISKKVREKLNEFEGLSDRNAKHMYIEKCQTTPGYHCSFYSVKVPIGGKFRRGNMSQLLGISDHQIVFLEDKTRELVAIYNLRDIQNIHHVPTDSCTLVLQFVKGGSIMFHVERESIARQIEIILDNFGQRVLHDIEKEDIDDWITNWGQSPSSLHTSAGVQDEHSQSTPSSPGQFGKELEETIIPITREESNDMTTPTTLKANGTPTVPLTPLDETLCNVHEKSFTYPDRTDEHSTFCDCPPDPEIPLHVDIRLLSLQEILQHPVEVARQVTLIDHERLWCITREELMQRAGLYPRTHSEPGPSSGSIASRSSSSIQSTVGDGGIERLAYRFNQVGNWVVHCVLQYTQEEDRGWVIQQFITTAQHCIYYRNYSSTMAIVVAGLCSPPIRRLKRTWEHVGKTFKEQLEEMGDLLSSKNNYKHYREVMERMPTPAVPYFGIFTRDLTFISDGNPDYLRNVINLHKRRQLYAKIEEIRRFQSDRYNFEPVLALQEVLTNHLPIHEDDLHALSHSLEPSQQQGQASSQSDGRIRSSSVSSLTNLGFLKHSISTKTIGGSSSNILNV